MIVTLAGGVGAARFLEGVVQAIPPENVTAIVNTGDDITMHGLYISPDLDIVTYTLAGIVEPTNGWGIRDDTTNTQAMLKQLGAETWFLLGDRDLAVHIRRTELIKKGISLTEIADQIRRALGVASRVLPMSNQPIGTYIDTSVGRMHFENYLVQRHAQDLVIGVHFEGADIAQPAPGVLEAIHDAEIILIAPSNPIVSVGTILAVPGIRAALQNTNAPVVAISPIVGGAAIKGPAAPLMRALGYEVSALGVAQCYADIVDTLLIDNVDVELTPAIRQLGVDVVVTDTIMRNLDVKRALAQTAINAARVRKDKH